MKRILASLLSFALCLALLFFVRNKSDEPILHVALKPAGEQDAAWVMAHTSVLHFCGSAKPWKPRYPYRFGVLYQHYQQLERAGRL